MVLVVSVEWMHSFLPQNTTILGAKSGASKYSQLHNKSKQLYTSMYTLPNFNVKHHRNIHSCNKKKLLDRYYLDPLRTLKRLLPNAKNHLKTISFLTNRKPNSNSFVSEKRNHIRTNKHTVKFI